MRVAFLANSFHLKKTKSVDFLIEILRKDFGEVAIIPHKEAWAELPRKKWGLLVVFQKAYSPEELEAFGAERVVLVPMYDDTPLDETFWRRYKKFKVLCFSTTMNRLLSSYGLSTFGAQYFPQASEEAATMRNGVGLRGFFWPRTPSIDWKLIKILIGSTVFENVNIHWTPDIHSDLSEQVAPDELLSGRISVSSWTGDREQYFHHLSNANVFFASRTAEGIGMSFLEAMALGICVIAPNAPTMSEYIQDGVNGILYDPEKPAPIDFSRVGELGAAARMSILRGREKWIGSMSQLKCFLEQKVPEYRKRVHPFISFKGKSISRARRVYRFFKYMGRKR